MSRPNSPPKRNSKLHILVVLNARNPIKNQMQEKPSMSSTTSIWLHGCDTSPLFASIFYLKPMTILELLSEFGCKRWDFNFRDVRLYETRKDGLKSRLDFCDWENRCVVKKIVKKSLIDTQIENNIIKIYISFFILWISVVSVVVKVFVEVFSDEIRMRSRKIG